MMEFILNYMERKHVYAVSFKEQERLEQGIRLYLSENGIDSRENRIYYRNFVHRHLEQIAPEKLKAYFLLYPSLSEINQMVIEARSGAVISEERKRTLYFHLEKIEREELGADYVPIAEIKQILGRYA